MSHIQFYDHFCQLLWITWLLREILKVKNFLTAKIINQWNFLPKVYQWHFLSQCASHSPFTLLCIDKDIFVHNVHPSICIQFNWRSGAVISRHFPYLEKGSQADRNHFPSSSPRNLRTSVRFPPLFHKTFFVILKLHHSPSGWGWGGVGVEVKAPSAKIAIHFVCVKTDPHESAAVKCTNTPFTHFHPLNCW